MLADKVGGRWLFLACVIDICSRRVLGWSTAPHMRTELVIDALRMAVAARGRRRGRCGVPLGPRVAVHLHGVRAGLRPVRGPQEHGPGRLQLRQRAGRESVAEPETRGHVQDGVLDDESGTALEIFRWLTYYDARRRTAR